MTAAQPADGGEEPAHEGAEEQLEPTGTEVDAARDDGPSVTALTDTGPALTDLGRPPTAGSAPTDPPEYISME